MLESHILEAVDLLDLLLVSDLVNTALGQHGIPPIEKEVVADQLEPRGDDDAAILGHALLQQDAKLLLSDPLDIANLVGAGVDVNELLVLRAHEKDVVDLVLTPGLIRRSKVVNAGQEVEVIQRNILGLNSQLVEQLALGSSTNTQVVLLNQLIRGVEGVGAAGVGPCVGEGDLFGRTLLQQELGAVSREQEDRESTVKKVVRQNVLHQVA